MSRKHTGTKQRSSGSGGGLSIPALKSRLALWRDGGCADGYVPLGSSIVSAEIFHPENTEIYFPSTLSAAERRVVHQAASAIGLYHTTITDPSTEAKVICVSRNPILVALPKEMPKPHTPHKALMLSDDDHLILKNKVCEPLNPVDPRHVRYLDRVIALSDGIKSLSSCDVDISNNPCIFVDTIDGLRGAVEHIERCHEFAFDLEMHSVRSYHGITCLIQIAVSDSVGCLEDSFPYKSTDYVIDCIALWDHISPYLSKVFADPSIVKIGHALRMDVAALYRDFAIIVRPVFDTQAAWSVLSDSLESGGMIGLAPLLCHYGAAAGSGEYMVKIKKDLSQYDWRRRPLPLYALQYAQMDVHLLIPAAYILISDLFHKEKAETQEEILDIESEEDGTRANVPGYGFVDMAFYQSQMVAANLWSARKPVKSAEAWASYNESPFRQHGERDGECDQQVDKSEDADELKELSDLNIPLQIADSLSPSDTPFDTVVNHRRSIHVHVSGSRSKLGKAITNLRRSTKHYRGLNGSIPWQTDINLLVTQRLLEWRDLVGREYNESPTYVCPTKVLLLIAERQPQTLAAVQQLWSPLPDLVLRLEKQSLLDSSVVEEVITEYSHYRPLSVVVSRAVAEYNAIIENFKCEQKNSGSMGEDRNMSGVL